MDFSPHPVGPVLCVIAAATLALAITGGSGSFMQALAVMVILCALLLNGYGFLGLVVGLPVIATLKLIPEDSA